MKNQLIKLERALGGIKFMRRVPQAIFVTSIRNEDIAIKEARKMKIPVFGIADTNVDPYSVNFPIFGNDDANKSTALVTTIIADAIASAKGEKQLAAYIDDENIEIMGLIPQEERSSRLKREFKPGTERRDFKPRINKIEVKIKTTKVVMTNEDASKKDETSKTKDILKKTKDEKER